MRSTPLLALAAALLAACEPAPTPREERTPVAPRIVLRDTAARQLGLAATTLPEIQRAQVPPATRAAAAALRDQLRGAADSVRFFSADGATYVALIPTLPFEGEDPHVLAAFDAAGGRPSRVVLPTFAHVVSYCPAGRGTPDAASSARDSADGCRYFTPPMADTVETEP
jgi:hypothetical protein